MVIAAAAASGPGWTDVLTGVGTVLVAVVAVGVALFADWRADRRLRKEQAYGRAQIEEERCVAREREQLAQAYTVQLSVAAVRGEPDPAVYPGLDAGDWQQGQAAVVVNRGRYVITGVEARFCYAGSDVVEQPREWVRFPAPLPAGAQGDLVPVGAGEW